MKKLILTNCILIILAPCSQTNLLTYKHKKYYSENSIITSDSVFKLYQNVCYNRPGVIDEEFCHELTLTFLDTTAAKIKKILNLATDTLIVKSHYGIFSVWNWDDENNKVSGQIEIINWSNDGITLSENIITNDQRRKEIKKYKGTRTFNKKEGW
jgi:hypothetical protein